MLRHVLVLRNRNAPELEVPFFAHDQFCTGLWGINHGSQSTVSLPLTRASLGKTWRGGGGGGGGRGRLLAPAGQIRAEYSRSPEQAMPHNGTMATLTGGNEVWLSDRPRVGQPGIVEILRDNKAAMILGIRGTWFGDDDAEELGAALAENECTWGLFMYDCSFGVRGLRSIVEGIRNARKMQLRIFAMNSIDLGDAGADILTDLLIPRSGLHYCLKILGASNCEIGAAGFLSISNALKTNRWLGCLEISDSKIGATAIHALLKDFTSDMPLRELLVHGCGIREEETLVLGSAWGANLALTMDFRLEAGDNITPRIREEAARVRALVLLRREKLVAFGMAMIKRLGGGPKAQARSTRSSREASVFHRMCKDVFRMVGEAYQY